MSSITPPSFLDDGGSFTQRIPHGLHPKHIAHWIDSTGSDTSAYTGSFVDDGADMLLPSHQAPGFGPIDSRFYKQKRRKERKDGIWNDNMQKAISGDIQRNLAKMKGIGGLEVKRQSGEKGKEGRGKEKDTVTIPIPPKWGTFVITAEDGRVIVVDRDGEFDSGPQVPQKWHEELRWVKAASTIEPPSPTEVSAPPSPLKHRTSSHATEKRTEEHAKEKEKKHRRDRSKKAHHKHLLSPHLKPLTPIPESDFEDGYQLNDDEHAVSHTEFFMTGGADGWPSRAATSVASPTFSVSKGYDYILPASPAKVTSSVRSPPGGWPSPPLSPLKSVAAPEQSWGGREDDKAWEEDRSQRSHKTEKSHISRKSEKSHKPHKSSRHDLDNVSARTYSTYKPPTVEDAPDTSSEERRRYTQTGWGGSKKESHSHLVGSEQGSRKSSSRKNNPATEQDWRGSTKASEKSWNGSAKAAEAGGWIGSQAGSEKPWNASATGPTSKTSWDGYERAKTRSEVSVAGSGSERSALSSHARSTHGAKASSHYNQRSGSSHRSRSSRGSSKYKSPTGWDDSQASRQSWSSAKARVDDDGWGGSQKKSEAAWGGSKHGSERSKTRSEASGSRYRNGYDEDNETYLNENWGGTAVRVGSRRTSVAGWD